MLHGSSCSRDGSSPSSTAATSSPKLGTFYGVGVGPGDPTLMTVKGASVIAACRHVFAPKSEPGTGSTALAIARGYVAVDAHIEEMVFPMTRDSALLAEHWGEAARRVTRVLESGEDACFLTLGDPLLYSTYIYLLRGIHRLLPDVRVVTVPGVPAFCAAASLAEVPLGEGRTPVTIVPTAVNLDEARRALATGSTVVLMKIGNRLGEILELLDHHHAVERAVFVARAGLPGEQVVTDLSKLRRAEAEAEAGYLSVVLVPGVSPLSASRATSSSVSPAPAEPQASPGRGAT